MDRGLNQTPPQQITPEFNRVSEPDYGRKADIDLKAERISCVADERHEGHYDRFFKEHQSTPYSAEDIERLQKPNLTPTWAPEKIRVVGKPKDHEDTSTLASADARQITDSRKSQIRTAAETMKMTGAELSNGKVTQNRRGNDPKEWRLPKTK